MMIKKRSHVRLHSYQMFFFFIFTSNILEFLPVDLVQSVHTYHEWFLCNVPSDHSVHTGWNSLLQILPVRDMKLNRCLGCNLYTHVTSIAPSKMLINKDLLVRNREDCGFELSKSFQDDTTVSEVHHDPSYSKIAKIVLPARVSSSNMTRSSGSQGKFFPIFENEIFIV